MHNQVFSGSYIDQWYSSSFSNYWKRFLYCEPRFNLICRNSDDFRLLQAEIGYLVQYLVLCVLFTWKSWVHSTVVEVQVYILFTRRVYFLLILLYCVLEYARTEFWYYSTDLLSIGTEYKCTRKAPVLFERSLITSFSDRRMIENWLMKVGFQLLSTSIFSFHERVRNPAYPLTTPSRDPGQLEQLNCRF